MKKSQLLKRRAREKKVFQMLRCTVSLHLYSIFPKMSDGNLRPLRGIHLPLVPSFPLGTFQSEQNVASSLVYHMHSLLFVGRPFQRFDSSIRPLPSASLPGESSGIFTSRQPFYIRPKTKMSTIFHLILNLDLSGEINWVLPSIR